MALKGTITHKDMQVDAYIKVSINGISEVIVNIEGPNYNPLSWAKPAIPTPEEIENKTPIGEWKNPGSPTEEEFFSQTVPKKIHMVHISYALKAHAAAENFGNGNESFEFNHAQPLFEQAYAYLEAKFGPLDHV